jgi:hypothetical protein
VQKRTSGYRGGNGGAYGTGQSGTAIESAAKVCSVDLKKEEAASWLSAKNTPFR